MSTRRAPRSKRWTWPTPSSNQSIRWIRPADFSNSVVAKQANGESYRGERQRTKQRKQWHTLSKGNLWNGKGKNAGVHCYLLRYGHRVALLKNHHKVLIDRQIMIVWEVLAHRLWHVKTDLLLVAGQEQAQLMLSLQETVFVLI